MHEDNAELLRAAGDGDQTSWNILVARYNGLLWSVTRGYGLNAADGSDAIQTAWLRLVENLGRITDPERIGSWLATTVRRECLRLIKRGSREPYVPSATEWLTEQPDPGAAPDHALLIDERDGALWAALAALSDRCQRLLRVLMTTPPPSYVDAAAVLEMPIGSIGPARQRCLDQLRRVVADDALLNDPTNLGEQ